MAAILAGAVPCAQSPDADPVPEESKRVALASTGLFGLSGGALLLVVGGVLLLTRIRRRGPDPGA